MARWLAAERAVNTTEAESLERVEATRMADDARDRYQAAVDGPDERAN